MTAPVLVLCMAGLYRRFRDAGYTQPKFLLPLAGRPILDHVIAGLAAPIAPRAILLVANRRDQAHAGAILDVAGRHGVGPDRLLFIADTSGQAETAMIGAERVAATDPDAALLFHNVDTILTGRDLGVIGDLLGRADGYIDVFDNDSAAYSYVVVEPRDGIDVVVDIAEKRPLSRHATTGLYGFATAADYLSWARATSRRSAGEFYVSDVYRTMLDAGRRVLAGAPAIAGETIVLGTPAEYEAHLAGRRR